MPADQAKPSKLAKKAVGGEAGADVQAHDTDVNDEGHGKADLCELIFGSIEQNAAAECAHAELGDEKRNVAGVEKRGHEVIGLGRSAGADPAHRDDGVDQIKKKEKRNRTQKFQAVISR